MKTQTLETMPPSEVLARYAGIRTCTAKWDHGAILIMARWSPSFIELDVSEGCWQVLRSDQDDSIAVTTIEEIDAHVSWVAGKSAA